MSTQMLVSDLLTDLSADEQQLLAGGRLFEMDEEDEEDDDDEKKGKTKTYRVRSVGIVRLRRID
jgi:hypothetical protein